MVHLSVFAEILHHNELPKCLMTSNNHHLLVFMNVKVDHPWLFSCIFTVSWLLSSGVFFAEPSLIGYLTEG